MNAQWDLVGEQDNGISDIWMLPDQGGYPVLSEFSGRKPAVLAGEGSFDQPYLVSNASELAAIAYYSYYDYWRYDLTADIDLSGLRGSGPVLWHFRGYLDGHGYCIRGFYQEGSGGLCDRIESGATVVNLHVEECEVKAENEVVGCLAGENRGLIRNCSVSGAVTGGSLTGGLVGLNTGSVWDCTFSGTAAGGQKTGGLAGENAGFVMNSISRGSASGDWDVGGLVAGNTGTIRSCYSTAVVTGHSNLGGLIGTNGGTVADSHAAGAMAGDRRIGGLVGQNGGKVSRCYSIGPAVGVSDVGGLIGSADVSSGSTSNSFWDIESSGIQISAGGTGIGREQMQDIDTFLDSGWDFVGETVNGAEDLWIMTDGSYPELTMSLKLPPSGGIRR